MRKKSRRLLYDGSSNNSRTLLSARMSTVMSRKGIAKIHYRQNLITSLKKRRWKDEGRRALMIL